MLFYLVRFALKIFADLFLEFLGKNRHRSVLSADISRYLDCQFVSLSHAFSTKDACHESSRKGVACATVSATSTFGVSMNETSPGVKT